MAELHRVCVYAGTHVGRDPAYRAAAEALARTLAGAGVGLVYGGGRIGLMGVLADAALAEGGEVIGVIPGVLVEKEGAHDGLLDLRVVGSMHERKALMADLADAFVALPGGTGTLEELIEAFTWTQLGLHRKPCGLLDAGGYYQRLVAFLDHSVAEGFLDARHRATLLVSAEPGDLLERLAAWEGQPGDRWIDRTSA